MTSSLVAVVELVLIPVLSLILLTRTILCTTRSFWWASVVLHSCMIFGSCGGCVLIYIDGWAEGGHVNWYLSNV